MMDYQLFLHNTYEPLPLLHCRFPPTPKINATIKVFSNSEKRTKKPITKMS